MKNNVFFVALWMFVKAFPIKVETGLMFIIGVKSFKEVKRCKLFGNKITYVPERFSFDHIDKVDSLISHSYLDATA